MGNVDPERYDEEPGYEGPPAVHAATAKALEQVRSVLEGAALSRMKGRGRSGFTGAGYHEPSYVYGRAWTIAEHHRDEIQGFPEMLADAEERARLRFAAEVAERGVGAFEHPNVAKRGGA